MSILPTLAKFFCLTIVLELSFFLVVGIRKPREILTVALAQLTNPVVVLFCLWAYENIDAPFYAWQIPLELLVVAVEGSIYKFFLQSQKHPFLLSLGANYFSFSFGCILYFYNISL